MSIPQDPAMPGNPTKRSKKQKRKERIARRIEEALLAEPVPITAPKPGQTVRKPLPPSKPEAGPSTGNQVVITPGAKNYHVPASFFRQDDVNVARTAVAQPPRVPLTPGFNTSSVDEFGTSLSTEKLATKRPRGPAKTSVATLKARDENWLQLGPIRPTENQEILTEKWWSSADLAKMRSERGLKYTTGKFLVHEVQQIQDHLETFKKINRLTDDELRTIIFAKKLARSEHGPFWRDLAKSVPNRPIKAVCQYVQRQWHPLARKGSWTKEEDESLLSAKMIYGSSWVQIGDAVERPPADCMDRWKNHLQHRETAKYGPWTKEEEAELAQIIKENYGGASTDPREWIRTEIGWSAVSAKMGHRRTGEQIKNKWSEQLARDQLAEKGSSRWSAYDAGQLIHRLQNSLQQSPVANEADVNWSSLIDSEWNGFSGKNLQRRFKTMKEAVPNHSTTAFSDLVTALTKSYPLLSSKPPKKVEAGTSKAACKAVSSKSKAIIEDSDEEAEGGSTATGGYNGLKRKLDEQEEEPPVADVPDLSNGESQKHKKNKKNKKHKERKEHKEHQEHKKHKEP